MRFKKAGLLSAGKVGKILKECFNISSLTEGTQTFMGERKHDNFIIAEDKGKVVGLISWHMHGLLKHQLVKIERLCITDKTKEKRIANGLIKAAIQGADKKLKKVDLKIRKIFVMIHSNDKKLKSFYKQIGFVEETKLKDHYYKGTDEYILSLFFE